MIFSLMVLASKEHVCILVLFLSLEIFLGLLSLFGFYLLNCKILTLCDRIRLCDVSFTRWQLLRPFLQRFVRACCQVQFRFAMLILITLDTYCLFSSAFSSGKDCTITFMDGNLFFSTNGHLCCGSVETYAYIIYFPESLQPTLSVFMYSFCSLLIFQKNYECVLWVFSVFRYFVGSICKTNVFPRF